MGKSFVIVVFFIQFMFSLIVLGIGCAAGLKVKIYLSMPDKGGLYRAQAKQLILYKDTANYRCVDPSDWEAILNIIKACKQ